PVSSTELESAMTLHGPVIHSPRPISAISENQAELDRRLRMELDKMLYRKYSQTIAPYLRRLRIPQSISEMGLTKNKKQCLARPESRMTETRDVDERPLGKRIIFYSPSFNLRRNKYSRYSSTAFPSISITGTECALQCEHCKGKLLESMIPARSPGELKRVLGGIKEKGGIGCLISGGCEAGGYIQLAPFMPAIAEGKAKLGLKIVVHTGLVDASTSRQLADTGIDCALIDIIGSGKTAREVCHLDVDATAYGDSLEMLRRAHVRTVPHVIVGLDHGNLEGELEAIRMISRCDPAAVVVIILTPVKGTGMEQVAPPEPESVAEILIAAKNLMPKVPILMGCVRPTGIHRARTDILAIRAGVNGIALPSREAIEFAEQQGFECYFAPHCCALIYEDLEMIQSLLQLGVDHTMPRKNRQT
ncbi:MAG: hypothetical protein V1857_02785, partial [archaeon]